MIIDNFHEWVWEVDTNAVYTYASPQVENILGYKPEELIGKTPFDFISETEASRVGKVFSDIAADEKPFSKLFNICLHKDGHQVHTETSGQPIYESSGILVGYRGIDFDRTEESLREQALQTNAQTLEKALDTQDQLLINVINSIPDMIFYKGPDYRYIGCNQAFSNFLGLPIEYIVGKSDFELFPIEYAELFRSKDTPVIQELMTYSNNEWVDHADGRRLYLLTKKSPLIEKNGQLLGMVGV